MYDDGERGEDQHTVRPVLSPADRISRTLARAENDSWLEQFGASISVLRIYDVDDNQNVAQHQYNDENEILLIICYIQWRHTSFFRIQQNDSKVRKCRTNERQLQSHSV
ncbi:hypothetical protein BWQ96_07171 [Gracilariopsis chorda]|uniref:Uncharacterized protein n=1 Tax=Gracilariopsis chorda TaxID=448386 RepID=A0A2V3ILX3_9FLOR|nr:hypothetical protein BWQ96_07171 [Gracilariopsis chorda]|eukprot:PXF43085.1 hypothetical protein BWQ96_07171 [Gracilariopsis chorda]